MHLLLALFGCPHERTTWPRTRRDDHGRATGHYLACLDCAAVIPYDWEAMRRGEPKGAGSAAVPQEDAG